jgi:hypothetical protein
MTFGEFFSFTKRLGREIFMFNGYHRGSFFREFFVISVCLDGNHNQEC